MQTTFAFTIGMSIIIPTVIIFFFIGAIIYFLFLYQRKRFRHQKEMLELREAFNQTLLESKLEIQEQTLDHIAKELHANFSHLVSLININLSEILPQGTEGIRDNIIETKSLAKQLLLELKALSASLNTDHIMSIGFAKALDNELKRLSKARKYQVTIKKTGQEYRLKPENEIILFRLSQEILNNILQYAKAKNIFVSLDYSSSFFVLEIADDGIGFNVEEALRHDGEKISTGLINIKKRAKLINADVNIVSKPSEGTTFTITFKNNDNIILN